MQQQPEIRDLQALIDQSGYTFRQLEEKDIEEAKRMSASAFAATNPYHLALGMDEEKAYAHFDRRMDFHLLLGSGLSFGAYVGEELVSASINIDTTVDFRVDNFNISEEAKRRETYAIMSKYLKTRQYEANQCMCIHILATKKEHQGKNLGVLCTYLAAKKAKASGFSMYITEASHIATVKTMEKVFKDTEVVYEEQQTVEGQKLFRKIVCGKF